MSQDCYMCGHLILEGQNWSLVIYEDEPTINSPQQTIHANPADHLPTLMPKGSAALEQLKHDAEYIAHGMVVDELDGTVTAERERAAKIVEESKWQWSYDNPNDRDVAEIVAKIRGNDD